MQFDSLGYTFRTGRVKSGKLNRLFVGFTPAVGKKALTAIRQKTRRLNYRNRTELSLPRHFVAGGVLWKILPVGDVSGLEALQQNASLVGDAEISTTERP